MALQRTKIAALMLFMLFLTLLQSNQTMGLSSSYGPVSAPTAATINCDGECERRCSKTSRHDKCIRACLSCCHTCNCVPPGTAGNKEACPCYANLLNPKNGVHKCP